MTCRCAWLRLRWNQVRACVVIGGGQTDPWHYLPLPEGASRAVTVTPGREGGRPGGWCRAGTLGKPPGRVWGSGDHSGTGDSGGQGRYGDSGGHGGSGASGGHGGIIFWDGLDRGAIVTLTKVPCMATMATRTMGICPPPKKYFWVDKRPGGTREARVLRGTREAQTLGGAREALNWTEPAETKVRLHSPTNNRNQ